MTQRGWCIIILAGFIGLPALADPTGAWAFETKIADKGCTISGTMTIEPEQSGAHACSFVSSETCGDVLAPITIDQTCRLRKDRNGRFIILSDVVQSLSANYDIQFYHADNFAVRPDGPARMTGDWWDGLYTAPVTFWREKAPPIS